MCICVDCRWVDRCSTYHAVETQHGVRQLSHYGYQHSISIDVVYGLIRRHVAPPATIHASQMLAACWMVRIQRPWCGQTRPIKAQWWTVF